MQVYARKLLNDDEEQILLRHPGNLVAELEPLEDVEVVRESIDVLLEVGLETCRVAEQRLKRPRCRVVEGQAGLAFDLGAEQFRLIRIGTDQCNQVLPMIFEHAVEPAQDGHRKDDVTVLVRLVVTAELIGNAPNEGSKVTHAGIS